MPAHVYANFTTLKHMALNLLRRARDKLPVRARRKAIVRIMRKPEEDVVTATPRLSVLRERTMVMALMA